MFRETTDKKIIRAYCQLLTEKDQESISLTDIYTTANISRSSFYNYFQNVKDLEQSIVHYVFDHLSIILNHEGADQKERVIKALQFIQQEKDIYHSVLTNYEQIDWTVRQFIKETLLSSDIPNFKQGLEEAYHMPFRFSLELYVSSIQTILTTWVQHHFEESPEEIAEFLFQALPF